MTIDELIAELVRRRERFGNIDVVITWEGTRHAADLADIYFAYGDVEDGETKQVLMLNADEGYYRDRQEIERKAG